MLKTELSWLGNFYSVLRFDSSSIQVKSEHT